MAIRPELRKELMKLADDERLELAEELYASVPAAGDDSSMDQAWANEIRRRIEQIRSGLIEGVPAQKVFAQVRERLAARRVTRSPSTTLPRS